MLQEKKVFAWSDMTLTFNLETHSKSLQTLVIKGTLLVKYKQDQTEAREYKIQTRNFYINSVMTSTLDLETSLRSLHNLHPKALCGLSMSQAGPKEEKICFSQVISDGHTE